MGKAAPRTTSLAMTLQTPMPPDPGGAPPAVRGTKGRFGAPLGAWYPVARDSRLRQGLRVQLHGRDLLLQRDAEGAVTAPDRPDLLILSSAGLVWARQHDDDGAASAVPPVMEDEVGGARFPMIACSEIELAADYDQAVLGLVDPAHVPMVHDAWWWRSSPRRRVKTKHYSPSPFGFTATAADSFTSAPAYALAGSKPRVTIEFRLPSTRIERVESGGFRLVNLTTVTPSGPGRVILRNVIYCTVRPMRWLYPALSALGRAFLEQDGRILRRLESHASVTQPLLFVGAPDQPSLWYFQCKAALARAAQGAAFVNPVRPTVLQWRT